MTLTVNALATLGANLVVRAFGMAALFISRRMMGPGATGIWNLIQLVTNYSMAINSGVVSGAERALPYDRGKGDLAGEETSRRLMFGAALMEGAWVAGLVALGLYWTLGDVGDHGRLFLWVGVYVLLWRFSDALFIALKSRQEFVLLSRLQTILAIIDLLLVASLTAFMKLEGQCLAFALSLAARIALYIVTIRGRRLFSIRPSLDDGKALRNLAATGLPLVAGNLAWQWLVSVESIAVGGALGITALGYYALGLSIGRAAEEAPTAVSSIVFPRLMEDFGRGDDLRKLGEDLHRYMHAVIFVIVPIVVPVLAIVMGLLVWHLLPNFRPAQELIPILIASGVLLALIHLPIQVFVARRRTGQALGLILAACLIKSVAVFFAAPGGIEATARAAAGAHAATLVLATGAALAGTVGPARATRLGLGLAGGLLYTLAVTWFIVTFWPIGGDLGGDLGHAAIGLVIATGVGAAPVAFGARRIDLGRRLATLWRGGTS